MEEKLQELIGQMDDNQLQGYFASIEEAESYLDSDESLTFDEQMDIAREILGTSVN